MDSNFLSQHRLHLIAFASALVASGCGGGGGEPAAASAPLVAARPVEHTDLQIAQSIYGGGSRTPQGFYAETAPSGQAYVSTVHLKNGDVATLSTSDPSFELCTNDWNQALAWSEASALNAPVYADLVETNEDARYFEFGRMRAGQPQFYERARVFKCTYLDRTNANLRATSGPAGVLHLQPVTAADVRTLTEYLWQFTTFNNFGHVVLQSSGAAGATLMHTLHIGSLVRGGLSASCDRIDVLAWRHTVNAATGQLQLDVETLWSFGARETAGVATLCSE